MVNRKRFLILAMLAVFLCGAVGVAMATNQCTDDWWSSCQTYNRPEPRSNGDPGLGGARTYDYVPQELGIYDTGYWELGETDCRGCHGDSLANRHHFSPMVIEYGQCTPICHDPDPNAPGGVTVTRDCTTAGCHNWINVTGPNGWHHQTDMSQGNACVVCHDQNIIAEITAYRPTGLYPPSVITPTPFSCENCHFSQDVVTGTDSPPQFGGTGPGPIAITFATQAANCQIAAAGTPGTWAIGDEVVIVGVNGMVELNNNQHTLTAVTAGVGFTLATNSSSYTAYTSGGTAMRVKDNAGNPTAGHPSDFNHLDPWGNNIGYFEYGKPIKLNPTNHMMQYMSNITAGACYKCHGMDPNQTGWVHTNPELIRYCEICHDMYSLHTIYGHVGYDTQGHVVFPDGDGGAPAGYPQDATGWVATGFNVTGESGDDPFDYTTFNCNGSPDPNGPDEQCLGCHVDQLGDPPIPIDCSGFNPVITSMEPKFGTCEDIITVRGYNFSEEELSMTRVEMAPTGTALPLLALLDPTAAGYPWIEVPVISDWTDTLLMVRIPCFVLPANGTYYLRVVNQCTLGSGLAQVFTYGGWVSLNSLSPCAAEADCDPANPPVTISGANFGATRVTMVGSYGVQRTVEFASSQFPWAGPPGSGLGPLVATNYVSWSATQIQVQFCGFFVDSEYHQSTCGVTPPDDYFPVGDCDDPNDPLISERNHIQDTIAGGDAVDEQVITGGEGIAVGTMEVYVVATYFKDLTAPFGQLNHGDTIYQIVSSDPEIFEVVNEPYINALRPRQQEPTAPTTALPVINAKLTGTVLPPYLPAAAISTPRAGLIRLTGENFGPTQQAGNVGDKVRIGTVTAYSNNVPPSQINIITGAPGTGDPGTTVTPGAGIPLRIKAWSSTQIGVYLLPIAGHPIPTLYHLAPFGWLNSWKLVWVVKDYCDDRPITAAIEAKVSNPRAVKLLIPLP